MEIMACIEILHTHATTVNDSRDFLFAMFLQHSTRLLLSYSHTTVRIRAVERLFSYAKHANIQKKSTLARVR